ncbi:MAG: DedA family protein [Pseudomonadota bacterium]|nr:DedA family protein [Pseudomonadota bacterium]
MPELLTDSSLMPWLLSWPGLFLTAFLAASLLPLGSEWLVVLMLQQPEAERLLIWLVASSGNVLGSVLNYGLGYWAAGWVEQRNSGVRWQRAGQWYRRYGVWSLLLAWLPLIGDPLTLIAGIMRCRFSLFLLLVAAGKSARYGLLILALI